MSKTVCFSPTPSGLDDRSGILRSSKCDLKVQRVIKPQRRNAGRLISSLACLIAAQFASECHLVFPKLMPEKLYLLSSCLSASPKQLLPKPLTPSSRSILPKKKSWNEINENISRRVFKNKQKLLFTKVSPKSWGASVRFENEDWRHRAALQTKSGIPRPKRLLFRVRIESFFNILFS